MKKDLIKLEAEKLLACEMIELTGGNESDLESGRLFGCDSCNKECQNCKTGGQ